MMVAPLMPLTLLGHRFGENVGWMGQAKERCRSHREADSGSRWHGAVEVWRRACVDEYMQDDRVVWGHGCVDDGPSKVDTSVPALEMDRRNMEAATSESASDWMDPVPVYGWATSGASGYRW
ncbi:hypothetical protein D1007_33802 [Hordeum vulgare]|nr:hypothetical protein D1007_33802 [Hordeum vulgare]